MGEKKERYSGFFAKRWDPEFSTDRKIKDDEPYVEVMKRDNNALEAGSDTFSIFLWDSQDSVRSCKIEEVEEFLEGASLVKLKSGLGIAGQRRGAWIYDRSSALSIDDEIKHNDEVTTATGLLRRLLLPRQDGNIRLVHIRKLDSHFILALGETASFHQVSVLRDAIWRHLTLQTSIRIKIPLKLRMFQMEIHISYFSLRTRPTQEKLIPDPVKKCFDRQWTDLSFLNIPSTKTDSNVACGIYESHMTFTLCGYDENNWVGYSFVDADVDEEELEDLVFPYEGFHIDPITNGVLQEIVPITDPREYFLGTYHKRIDQVFQEWEPIVRKFERCITIYKRENSTNLCKDSSNPGRQADDVKKTFDWNQQTMRVLNQLLDVLSQSIKVWDTFSSPNGDIGYFSDVDTSTGKLHSNILVSLRGIKETIDALETLKDKLELLEKGCCKFAEALQLRLTLEANEAVRSNGSFTQFTVSIISPVMVAIAYYSIPQGSAPFTLGSRFFGPAIIIIMAVVQVLFMATNSIPGIVWWWKKGIAWYSRLKSEREFRRFGVRERKTGAQLDDRATGSEADGIEMMHMGV